MQIGLIIVNWNVRDLLIACLDSVYADLAQSAPHVQGIVCVVDNASGDGSAAKVREAFPRTWLIEAENKGMGAGNNLGLRALLTQHPALDAVLILNPDTVLGPGALRALTTHLQNHPRAGVAAPQLLNPNGTLQHSGFRFPGLMQAFFDLFPLPGRLARLQNSPLNGRYPAAWYAAQTPFQVDHTLGAAFLVRRAALEQCGLFDETFALYCEEIDWHWRMAYAGWERWVVPAAVIVHYGGQSTAQAPTRSFTQLWKSRARLYQRYHSPALNALARLVVQAGLRRQIRANFQRAQRGEITPEYRAAINLALTETLKAWTPKRRI